MARFSEGTIAEIALEDTNTLPLRIDVLDAEAFRGSMVASQIVALDLTVHTQVLPTVMSGIKFGVKFYQMPVALLSALVTAMETAMLAGESFEVTLADDDGVDQIAVMAQLDYAALGGRPYTRGTFSGFYVRDITMRFISTGPNP